MEEKDSFFAGLTVKANDAPESHHVTPSSENYGLFGGSTGASPAPAPAPALATAPAPITAPTSSPASAPLPASVSAPEPVSVAAATGSTDVVKKKRGRPRKYGPDGKLALALSPMPISSSIPLTGDFSMWKRGRGRPIESVKKSFKCDFESPGPGDGIAYSVGANFTPHVLTVNAGEDVNMKVMSFSQQGSRAICILSANGTISNVTLRQPTSSGGTLTYEGRFEILSLSGSYMPSENGVTRSRSGGMSVSLAGPDGRVVGGGLAGLLVAAGPVQVVVGSFLPGHQQMQKPKKQKTNHFSPVASGHYNPIPVDEIKISFGGVKPIMTPAAFQADNNTASFNNGQGSSNSSADDADADDDDLTLYPEKDSNPSQTTNAGVAC
ncbi:LOW QUALITY PROTEIN: AT-hook motif nuclear-localized protein 6-like [Neltuma alba]|uniref:LOW QUALITY PROTEIN: AT-hook motif nuclear-localized protein 6-like n=1 Tax=Neltuma alba TaxID=207710 RepID=UPI0010A525F3|nr:LOW QUALITY PROTEIN: AT-hook motif nuclear-localized protein 6-like [Prosopis alba]